MYYRARMYDPRIGRFGQADPSEESDRCYKYVSNRPTLRVDPFGLQDKEEEEPPPDPRKHRKRLDTPFRPPAPGEKAGLGFSVSQYQDLMYIQGELWNRFKDGWDDRVGRYADQPLVHNEVRVYVTETFPTGLGIVHSCIEVELPDSQHQWIFEILDANPQDTGYDYIIDHGIEPKITGPGGISGSAVANEKWGMYIFAGGKCRRGQAVAAASIKPVGGADQAAFAMRVYDAAEDIRKRSKKEGAPVWQPWGPNSNSFVGEILRMAGADLSEEALGSLHTVTIPGSNVNFRNP